MRDGKKPLAGRGRGRTGCLELDSVVARQRDVDGAHANRKKAVVQSLAKVGLHLSASGSHILRADAARGAAGSAGSGTTMTRVG